MNTHRISAIVRKDLTKMIREPATLFLVILFPVMLTVVFGVSFGAVGGSTQSYNIGIVDHNMNESPVNWSHNFVENLSENNILNIQWFSNDASAQDAVKTGKVQAVIIIPENFSESCNSFQTSPFNQSSWVNATVSLYLDSGSMIAMQAIPPIIEQSLMQTISSTKILAVSLPVSMSSQLLSQTQEKKMFDYMVPGLFAYGAIFLIMTVSQSFTGERSAGLLRRINTTPITASEFMVAQVISNMVMAVLQVALIFLTAFLLGYSPLGGPLGLAMAFLIVAIFSLCCVGFGLITATVAKSAGAATGLSFVFIMPMMFLGTFVSGMSPGALSGMASRFVPSFYVTDALTSLFLRGVPLSNFGIIFDLIVVSVCSVVVFFIGILLFRKYGNI
ncbi:MAG: ABC transporter permease [Thermoplasmata archaeon]|nr:ABC transporter permease [Thermoplasmata archaeon]